MRLSFESLVTLATRRPRLSVAGVAVAVIAGALLVWLGPLEVSTSRNGLVSERVPHQARLVRFYRRFGNPDTTVLILSGGTGEQRQRVVDRLLPRLEKIEALKGRVLARIGPEQIAEIAILQRPELLKLLAEVIERQGTGALQGSLTAWVREFERQIEKGLQGEGPGAQAGTDERSYTEGLRQVADVIRAFDSELKGGDARLAFGKLAGGGMSGGQPLDDQGYLVGPDREHHIVVIFTQLQSDEGKVLAPLVRQIRAARDQALAEAGAAQVRGDLTGVPALAVDELDILDRGLKVSAILSATGILLLLWLSFRSLRYTLLALVPLGAGVVITLGLVQLIYGRLNLVTSSFTSVLMGMGIDFGVYLLQRYGEEQRAGQDDLTAMRSALILAGPGVATAGVCMALSFVAVTTTAFTAFSELGLITVVGLLVMLVCTFLLMPALLRLGVLRGLAPAPELPGLARVVAMLGRAPYPVLLLAAAATIGAAISFAPRGPGYNGRFFDFLPDKTESYRALRYLEKCPGMAPAFANLEVKSLEEARELSARLRAMPEVEQAQTASDLLPKLDKKRIEQLREGVKLLEEKTGAAGELNDTNTSDSRGLLQALTGLQDQFDEVAFALRQAGRDAGAAQQVSRALAALKNTVAALPGGGSAVLSPIERRIGDALRRALNTARAVAARGRYQPEDLPPLFRPHFVSKDGKSIAVFAYPSGDIWESRVAKRFARKILSLDPEASGLALNILPNERMIIEGFERAAVIAAVLIALTLLAIFRNVGDTVLSMIPVLLGWCWMLGAMKPLGLTFNTANMVALPLLLGVGVNAGQYIVHRYRQSRASGTGRARLRDLVQGTGAATIVASLTAMGGFAALMSADYRAMKSMGLLLTVGIGLALTATILVLPALLVVLKRAK